MVMGVAAALTPTRDPTVASKSSPRTANRVDLRRGFIMFSLLIHRSIETHRTGELFCRLLNAQTRWEMAHRVTIRVKFVANVRGVARLRRAGWQAPLIARSHPRELAADLYRKGVRQALGRRRRPKFA